MESVRRQRSLMNASKLCHALKHCLGHEFGWEIIGDLIWWKRMKALIFDFDGTLVDSVNAHVLATSSFCCRFYRREHGRSQKRLRFLLGDKFVTQGLRRNSHITAQCHRRSCKSSQSVHYQCYPGDSAAWHLTCGWPIKATRFSCE